jgi:hypothetical protein
MIAIGVAAETTWVHIGDVIAHRTIGDSFFHVTNGVDQSIGRVARRLEDVEGESLRAFGTNAGQTLQLFDQAL